MSLLTSNFRKPTASQAVLFGLILLCCSVDTARMVSIAGVSGLGAATLAAGGAVWAAWLLRPVLPRGLLVVLLPLILFQIDAMGTLFWYRPSGMDGVQLAVVGLTFLGVLMLSAREADADPDHARALFRAILITSVIPVVGWMLVILSGRVAGDELNLTRPFALYTLPVVAVALAMWLANFQPNTERTSARGKPASAWLPLLWVMVIAYVVLLGLSRTALVGILIMIPLAVALRGKRSSVVVAVLLMAIGAGSFLLALQMDRKLYNRFFHEDDHLKLVGGLTINGSGRGEIWNKLLSNVGDDWVFGKGLSSSEELVTRCFTNVDQPHNDYIRFYYDQGIIGLSIWLIFMAGFCYRTLGNLRRSIRYQTPDYPMHIAALLAVTSVSFSMLTDNSVCYTFVMVPLAIVMGSSLGTGAAWARFAASDVLRQFVAAPNSNAAPA